MHVVILEVIAEDI